MFTVVIPGEMRGKGRPKFARSGASVRAYTDAQTASAETWIRACAMEQAGQTLLEGPLAITLTIGVGVAKSWSKTRRELALSNVSVPIGKPDFDNVAKLVCDALNGILWRDDSQIADARIVKQYSATPSTTLTVTPL